MKTKFFLLIIIFFYSSLVFSQISDEIDSLKIELQKQKEDTLKVKILVNISQIIVESNLIEAEKYANNAIELASKINYKNGLGVAYNSIIIIYLFLQNQEKKFNFPKLNRKKLK